MYIRSELIGLKVSTYLHAMMPDFQTKFCSRQTVYIDQYFK